VHSLSRFGDTLRRLVAGNYDAGTVPAEAPVIPCSTSLYNTASQLGRVGPPSTAAIVLYRTAQPYNTVQDRSRSPFCGRAIGERLYFRHEQA
jgi:hypothetical protein